MELNWLQSLLYGAISGFAEILPIAPEAHRSLLLLLMGAEKSHLVELAVHLSSLGALILGCWPQLVRLQKERRLAAIHPKKRRRQPDIRVLKDWRFLRTALIPLLLGFVLRLWTGDLEGKLWFLTLGLTVNGIALYLPPYFPSGNKDSQTVSGLDGLCIGLGGILGVIPGLSRMAGLTTAGLLRGCSRSYILDMALLLSIPALTVLCFIDILALILAGAAVTGALALAAALAALASFGAAYAGIAFIRFLAVKVGFSGFSYYSWGAALFAFILYLTI